MRGLLVVPVIGVAIFLAGHAQAQTPPDKLFAGQTKQDIATKIFGASCYLNRGFSTFQRNGASLKAVISFNEIVDQSVYDLSGQAAMTFTTATSGIIHFKQTGNVPANVGDAPFSGFSQTYDPTTLLLVVKFSITFPDCTLPVTAIYEGV